MNSQRRKYDEASPELWRLRPRTAYDKELINFRFSLIERYGAGKDVMDLCCGPGAYMIPLISKVKSIIGMDFSRSMLKGLQDELGKEKLFHGQLVIGDAQKIPLKDASLDFVYSYTSLYGVPDVESVLQEVGRVLRTGGYAALELGGWSLNTLVCWAKGPVQGEFEYCHHSYWGMLRMIRKGQMKVVDWHPFQILPMYSTPWPLFFLYPLLTPQWKRIMGIKVGGRMLDEWVSRSWPLRYLAFRHLFVVQKAC